MAYTKEQLELIDAVASGRTKDLKDISKALYLMGSIRNPNSTDAKWGPISLKKALQILDQNKDIYKSGGIWDTIVGFFSNSSQDKKSDSTKDNDSSVFRYIGQQPGDTAAEIIGKATSEKGHKINHYVQLASPKKGSRGWLWELKEHKIDLSNGFPGAEYLGLNSAPMGHGAVLIERPDGTAYILDYGRYTPGEATGHTRAKNLGNYRKYNAPRRNHGESDHDYLTRIQKKFDPKGGIGKFVEAKDFNENAALTYFYREATDSNRSNYMYPFRNCMSEAQNIFQSGKLGSPVSLAPTFTGAGLTSIAANWGDVLPININPIDNAKIMLFGPDFNATTGTTVNLNRPDNKNTWYDWFIPQWATPKSKK